MNFGGVKTTYHYKTLPASPIDDLIDNPLYPKHPVYKTREAWLMIINAVYRSLLIGGDGITISLKPSTYTGTQVSYRQLVKLIDYLVENCGWKLIKGKVIDWDMVGSECFTKSVLLPPVGFSVPTQANISLTEKNVSWGEIRGIRGGIYNRIPSTHPDYEYFTNMRKTMVELNTVTSEWSNRLRYNGSDMMGIIQRRIFNEDLNKGGRLYHVGGGVQTLPKHTRSTIRMDMQYCSELDFIAMHPNMLLQMVGETSTEFDPYMFELTGLRDCAEGRDEYLHKHGYIPNIEKWIKKMIVLISLNSKSKRTAISAIRQLLCDEQKGSKDRDKIYLYDHKSVKVLDFVNSMLEHNKQISKFMFTGVGHELQRLDGDISMNIQHKLAVGMNECVIGVHDSFIVRESISDLAVDTMLLEWDKTFKNITRCFISE